MAKTTIQLVDVTKEELEALKEGDNESYDEVVWRLIEYYNQNAGDGKMWTEQELRGMMREEIEAASSRY